MGQGKTAAKAVLLAVLDARIDAPQAIARVDVEGADLGLRIDGKDAPVGDHWRVQDSPIVSRALAYTGAPERRQPVAAGQMMHGMIGVAAALRPGFIDIGARQANIEIGDTGIRFDRTFQG